MFSPKAPCRSIKNTNVALNPAHSPYIHQTNPQAATKKIWWFIDLYHIFGILYFYATLSRSPKREIEISRSTDMHVEKNMCLNTSCVVDPNCKILLDHSQDTYKCMHEIFLLTLCMWTKRHVVQDMLRFDPNYKIKYSLTIHKIHTSACMRSFYSHFSCACECGEGRRLEAR